MKAVDAIPLNSTLTSQQPNTTIMLNPLPTWVPHLFLICFQHPLLLPTLNHCIIYILLLPLALFPVSICRFCHIDTGESSPHLGPSSPLDLFQHLLLPPTVNHFILYILLIVLVLPGDPIPWTMVLHHASDTIPQKIRNYDLIPDF